MAIHHNKANGRDENAIINYLLFVHVVSTGKLNLFSLRVYFASSSL